MFRTMAASSPIENLSQSYRGEIKVGVSGRISRGKRPKSVKVSYSINTYVMEKAWACGPSPMTVPFIICNVNTEPLPAPSTASIT
jgi:hypothetical protein